MKEGRKGVAMRSMLFLVILGVANAEDTFHETLTIKPLPHDKTLFTFHFNLSSTSINHQNHFTLFPKSLGHIIKQSHIDEAHLTFTQGRWDHQQWGAPEFPAPIGLEAYAWFQESDSDRIGTNWKYLTNSLGGIFCSSLQNLDQKSISSPVGSFFPSVNTDHPSSIRHGTLPREQVCTENLTPWLKMLPCREHSGLAALLNPLRIFDSHFHSMSVHLLREFDGLRLHQILTVVLDHKEKSTDLKSLFKRDEGVVACPLATSSEIVFQDEIHDLKSKSEPFTIDVKPNELAKADLSTSVLVRQHFTGYGQEFGGVSIHIDSTKAEPLDIVFFESFPYYMRMYLHTMNITIDGGPAIPIASLPCANLRLASNHEESSTIQLCFEIPPLGSLVLDVQFEKSFLHYTAHPPDAHRGFAVGPAVVTVVHPTRAERIYSQGLLLSLPTPDFSMLYNVITLTGTVTALFFGSTFNLTIRRWKDTFNGRDFVSDRPVARAIRAATAWLKKRSKPKTQ